MSSPGDASWGSLAAERAAVVAALRALAAVQARRRAGEDLLDEADAAKSEAWRALDRLRMACRGPASREAYLRTRDQSDGLTLAAERRLLEWAAAWEGPRP